MDQLLKIKAFLTGRKTSYQITFGGEHAKFVLSDLAKFCRANDTTFHADPRIHAVLEGRREVWLRITKHLNLSNDQLLEIFSRKGE